MHLKGHKVLTLSTQYGIIHGEWRKMPYFSKRSLLILDTCNPLLREIAHEAIEIVDFSVIHGFRGRIEQNTLWNTGYSKVRWPSSKHNKNPSQAFDLLPYPSGWKEREKFFFLAGVVFSVGKRKEIFLRWGGDWDRNPNTKEKFEDLAHFELLG